MHALFSLSAAGGRDHLREVHFAHAASEERALRQLVLLSGLRMLLRKGNKANKVSFSEDLTSRRQQRPHSKLFTCRLSARNDGKCPYAKPQHHASDLRTGERFERMANSMSPNMFLALYLSSSTLPHAAFASKRLFLKPFRALSTSAFHCFQSDFQSQVCSFFTSASKLVTFCTRALSMPLASSLASPFAFPFGFSRRAPSSPLTGTAARSGIHWSGLILGAKKRPESRALQRFQGKSRVKIVAKRRRSVGVSSISWPNYVKGYANRSLSSRLRCVPPCTHRRRCSRTELPDTDRY